MEAMLGGESPPFSDADIGVLLAKDIPVEMYLDVGLELMGGISRILGTLKLR